MDQEKIGKKIKEIRKKANLSQNEFAQKYGITYQAVSKWENGKNIPDIQILKQICSDYNLSLEELLEMKKKSDNYMKKIIIPIIIFITIIILIYTIIFMNNKNDNFEFKTLSTTSEIFKLTGSIAYNKDKTSIYISNIEYLKNDNTEYKKIESTLYEINGKVKKEISNYDKTLLITLNDFLKNITFNSDNHARVCEEYTEESLLIEILATDKDNKITKYEIPISISENCQK